MVEAVDIECSRTGRTAPLGKFDAALDLRIHSETKDRLAQLAAEEGLPTTEFIRTVLEVRAWGIEHAARLAVQRLERVVGIAGQNVGRNPYDEA